MTVTGDDIFRVLGYVQDDLRGAQAKLVEVRAMLATLNLPSEQVAIRCPDPLCAVVFKSERKLAEHLYQLHGGPEPEHWRQAETLAGES